MIAIISDIHGNYYALKSVLEYLDSIKCENIYSLGDVVGYYGMVNECIQELKEREIINIMGNHDYYMLNNSDCPRSFSANLCLNYQRKTIKQENLDWLKKSVTKLDLQTISMRHGGWNDCLDEYIEEFDFNIPEELIDKKIFVSGHTHKAKKQIKNKYIYCNPGSIGQPRDYDNRASFAIIDNEKVILKRIEYDIEAICYYMKSKGFDRKIYDCLYSGCKIGER